MFVKQNGRIKRWVWEILFHCDEKEHCSITQLFEVGSNAPKFSDIYLCLADLPFFVLWNCILTVRFSR